MRQLKIKDETGKEHLFFIEKKETIDLLKSKATFFTGKHSINPKITIGVTIHQKILTDS